MGMVVPRVSTAVTIKAGQYGKDISQDGMLCLRMRSILQCWSIIEKNGRLSTRAGRLCRSDLLNLKLLKE
jgi:hypothetical protein